MLHHHEYRERYAANLRRELPWIPFAVSSSTLSSRAKSRDLLSAGSQSAASVRGNSPAGPLPTPANSRSFDSENRPASESGLSAQDDNVGKIEATPEGTTDVDVFRAFVKAGQRMADIHVHYEEQAEYPLVRPEIAGEKLDYRVTKMCLSKDKTSLIYNQFLTLSGIAPETYEYRLGNRSALEWVIDQYQVSTDTRSGITNDPNLADDPQYILRLIGEVITVSLETVSIVKSFPELRFS